MMAINKEHIIDVLKQCFDPEIPVDLWNLGLIYDIKIDEPNVVITMSLTTPGCGMAQMMAEDIKTKVTSLNGIEETTVEVTFDPPWNPEMMSNEAKEKLGFSPTKTQSENISTEWD
jgi:metal-sulfur cluster biosynthetic enzyme